MATELNPFEYTLLSFLGANEGQRFTSSEIAKHCKMNSRTSKKYCKELMIKKMIKSEKVRNQTNPRYFVE
jgi:predicted transcriptional regulator